LHSKRKLADKSLNIHKFHGTLFSFAGFAVVIMKVDYCAQFDIVDIFNIATAQLTVDFKFDFNFLKILRTKWMLPFTTNF
jgi:hypothetical protein